MCQVLGALGPAPSNLQHTQDSPGTLWTAESWAGPATPLAPGVTSRRASRIPKHRGAQSLAPRALTTQLWQKPQGSGAGNENRFSSSPSRLGEAQPEAFWLCQVMGLGGKVLGKLRTGALSGARACF